MMLREVSGGEWEQEAWHGHNGDEEAEEEKGREGGGAPVLRLSLEEP